MCGIVGIFHNQNAPTQIKQALSLLHSRGKDGVGLSNARTLHHSPALNTLSQLPGPHLIGHTLHAIVDHVPQPIKNKGILTANCEIYNWQELAKKYSLSAKNDAELLLHFLDKFGTKKLQELDGVFAFAYWQGNTLTLARDIIGEKPLWFMHTRDNFVFASEKKVLEQLGYSNIEELNPRHILMYDLSTKKMKTIQKPFFTSLPEHQESYSEIRKKTRDLLGQAIQKRLPSKKFGLLFSGGIDSTYIAHYLKQQGYDFTCYTAVLDTQQTPPSDLLSAQKVAKELGLKLKIKKLKQSRIPAYLQKIVPLIEDSNVVKVGVALTFYLACELAKKDGCKVIFSGLGSEEIFAGYDRHKKSSNINQECISGLIKMYERDLYRDDVLTMHNGLELRLPFLDITLASYALKIPSQYKIKGDQAKVILRDIAKDEGLCEEIYSRKKTAAQYGSRFDDALGKLAKSKHFTTKSAYLKTFYPSHNLRLGVLFSGGKDSTYAAYIMKKQNYDLTCLITIKSKNSASYMFHTPAIDLTSLQAKAMSLPLVIQETAGVKETELLDLKRALKKAKAEHKIQGVITGAVFSTYQRDRIEKICEELSLKIFSPLWHKDQEQEMVELLANDFSIILTAIAAQGLDKEWLAKEITPQDLLRLRKLQAKVQLNINGEGGEYESLVLNCPLFNERLEITESKAVMDSSCSGILIIKKAVLLPK